MSYFLIFFLSISLFGFLLGGILLWQIVRMIHWIPVYNFVQKNRRIIWFAYFGVFSSVPFLSMLTYIWSGSVYHPLLSLLYTLSVWGLLVGGYLFMASIVSWIIGIGFIMIQHRKNISSITLRKILLPFLPSFTFIQKTLIVLPVFIAIITVVYGTIYAGIIQTTHYTISANSGLRALPDSWIGKNIVIYSDTHIGTIRKKKFLNRVVEHINAQNPYITIMAGDLIDGPKFPHSFLEPFQNLTSVAGNYYTPGNHEEYSHDASVLHTLDTYLTRISDNVHIVDGVAFVGMEYNREPTQVLSDRIDRIVKKHPEIISMPKIGILHDPKNINALLSLRPNLTISGHTHGGQIWPGNLLVKKIYGVFAYGPSHHNNNQTLHITTSGIGTAQSPVRIGTRAEIVVITVTK
jgi:predicted MPP superfamily phosphohydrolase